jgi:hypothetical protein
VTPKSSTLHAVAGTSVGIQWPAPPFFKLATPLPPQDVECDIQLADGRVMHEKLVEFEPGMGSVGLRRPPPQGISRVGFAKIRSIKLTQPVNYIVDATVLRGVGANEHSVDNRKSFVVCLADGSKMTGTTLGFVQDETGLFLFLPGADPAQAINCFLPAGQVTDVQIGPLLGESGGAHWRGPVGCGDHGRVRAQRTCALF